MTTHGYYYDAFISYPHDKKYKDWVTKIFCNILILSVRETLGKSPNFFIDRDAVHCGDDLPHRLQQGLARAKVLIPVWGVAYFESEWCKRECAAMLQREEQIMGEMPDSPLKLIFPVQLYDGSHTPELLKNRVYFDCTKYNKSNPVFESSQGYNDLEDYIMDKVTGLVEQIRRIEYWNDGWEHNLYMDKAYKKFKDRLKITSRNGNDTSHQMLHIPLAGR